MSAVRAQGALARVCGPDGRVRGTAFALDECGTLLTADETLLASDATLRADGVVRPVAAGEGTRPGDDGEREGQHPHTVGVVALAEWDLALLHAPGLLPEALVVAADRGEYTGASCTLGPGGPEVRVTGTVAARYAPPSRRGLPPFRVPEALRLVPVEPAAERYLSSPEAAGTPLVDPSTGAVLAVVTTALRDDDEAPGGVWDVVARPTATEVDAHSAAFAVPLPSAALPVPDGPLAAALRHNGAHHPGWGQDLNLAGALHLTAASVAPVVEAYAGAVARPQLSGELTEFTTSPASVAALVAEPGTGRTTELAMLAARRARGGEPVPTVWLRGAELRETDAGVRAAVGRSLLRAGRILAASRESAGETEQRAADPDVVARLARDAGRPLLVVLDAPEEMPPALAARLVNWVQGTVGWLGATGARLLVGCRPEFWEYAGALVPPTLLYTPGGPAPEGPPLPPALRCDVLPAGQAARLRRERDLPDGTLAPRDADHPLAIRYAAEVRAAQRLAAQQPSPGAPLERADLFEAHLDAVALRLALRLTVGERSVSAAALRRLSARAAGRLHEAARRCLGPGQGELARAGFEELFPWAGSWAPAVLAEEVLVPAGDGYRFADEEFGDWLQGRHLRLSAALAELSRPGEGACSAVPRYRLGPVVEALVRHLRRSDADVVATLRPLVAVAVPGGAGPALAPAEGGAAAAAVQGDANGRLPEGSSPSDPEADAGAGLVNSDVGASGRMPLQGPRDGVPRRAVVAEGPATTGAPGAGPGTGGEPTGVRGAPGGHAPADPEARVPQGRAHPAAPGRHADRAADAATASPPTSTAPPRWWAARLLSTALLRLPEAEACLPVLASLAARVGAVGRQHGTVPAEFGLWFWRRLRLSADAKMALLRYLVPADHATRVEGERFLDLAAELHAAEPARMRPALCRWFEDDTSLAAVPEEGPRPTVAKAAQALLYAHRGQDVRHLVELLAQTAHPCAEELLAELLEEEPAALCRAVHRWATDPKPQRRVLAAEYGARVAARAAPQDLPLLRAAALALWESADDAALHGAALAVLIRDPGARAAHLPAAAARFAASGGPQLARALGTALADHPEQVVEAFRARLRSPGAVPGELFVVLDEVPTEDAAVRVARVLAEAAESRPEPVARALSAGVGGRLDGGWCPRALRAFTRELLDAPRQQVRSSLAEALVAVDGPLRDELLGTVIAAETAPGVLEALLEALLRRPAVRREGAHVRALGERMAASPGGAVGFDAYLGRLAGEVPGVAEAVAEWVAAEPEAWAPLVGVAVRRRCMPWPDAGTPSWPRPRSHGALHQAAPSG